MPLEDYIRKRDFNQTPEPKAVLRKKKGALRFVVQRHQARRLHYDLRLEMDGVLKSWAVPKGPSMNPADKRLSIHTEDHPLDYLTFEGVIPKGNYGAGTMAVWDSGTYQGAAGYEGELADQLAEGNLKIEFFGKKIRGVFALVHTRRGEKNDQWLLIKKEDDYATQLSYDAEDLVEGEEANFELDSKQMVRPMLATKASTIFSKPDWIYEIKWDGYRMLANIKKGKVHLYSRNGITYNHKFQTLYENLQAIPYEAILDGEVVVLNENGVPEFQKLQNFDENTEGELRYYVFDLLYLNGHDMTHLPLIERKSLIEEVIEDIPLVYYCDHVASMGINFYEQVIAAGLEGVIAKKADSSYILGSRTENWLKIKSMESQEVIICGYTESDGQIFGSLILGLYKEEQLTYVGNCGSGFNDDLQREMVQLFEAYLIEKNPFGKRINLKGRKPHWLSPELICEVKFSEWTTSGSMRHPVFKGMRTDKIPREIGKERETEAPAQAKDKKTAVSTESLEINGFAVPISNLDKVYWPDSGITKYQLIDYYMNMAEYILPFLKDRPQNLHRHPEGIQREGFYQKDTAGIFPHWIDTVKVFSKSNEKEIEYLLCQNEATLLYMANLGCIEINPWNSAITHLDHPDYSVIDIDPSDKNTFGEVIEVAQVIYSILKEAKISGYCKTSGSSGLHIYLPLEAQYTYDEARDFTKLLCFMVQDQLPGLTSMERKVDKRKGKIYLDYLQNRKGQTLAAPYCVRPKPGATVSAPLEWKEVKSGLDMHDFNIFTMVDRIKEKPRMFNEVLGKGINIEKVLEQLEGR